MYAVGNTRGKPPPRLAQICNRSLVFATARFLVRLTWEAYRKSGVAPAVRFHEELRLW